MFNDFDTFNLRHDANFRTEIHKNVFWVPVNTLGRSKISNSEIKKILHLLPEEKKEKINTLYEAIQLFQIGEFKDVLDNIELKDSTGLIWEHHKPAYITVQHNYGCCSSVASWLVYMLSEKYNEIGLISYLNINGKGHVFNYIKENNKYYFIDLYCFTDETLKSSTKETGNFADFSRGLFLTGMLIEANSIEDFADYFSRYMILKSRDFIFFQHQELNCCPINQELKDNKIIVNLPNNFKVTAINNKRRSKNIIFKTIDPPQLLPTWS